MQFRRDPDHSTGNLTLFMKKLVSSKMNLGISRYPRKTTLHVIKRSVISNMSTSCPLEPNYSYRAEGSTSHVNILGHCALAQRSEASKRCSESQSGSEIVIFIIFEFRPKAAPQHEQSVRQFFEHLEKWN